MYTYINIRYLNNINRKYFISLVSPPLLLFYQTSSQIFGKELTACLDLIKFLKKLESSLNKFVIINYFKHEIN